MLQSDETRGYKKRSSDVYHLFSSSFLSLNLLGLGLVEGTFMDGLGEELAELLEEILQGLIHLEDAALA